ncbi:MAG: AAA family ATPase [Acidimicrobiia bacterium]
MSNSSSRIHVAVTNQKGGVGKSTTAVNMGAALAGMGERVLIIDADPQSNATSGLGVDRHAVQVNTYDVMLGEASIDDGIEPTSVKDLFLVPSSIDLAAAEIELVARMSRERRLAEVLEGMEASFDIVFIDCPPSLGLITVNALTAADEILIPIQTEYYALEGLTQLLRSIEAIQSHLNPRLKLEGAVLTMYDGRTTLATEVSAQVREHFGDAAYKTVIPRTVRLAEAPSYGEPIEAFDPKSKGAAAYRALAREWRKRHGRST